MLPRKSLLKRRRIGGARAENIVGIVLTDSNLSCLFQADSVSKLLQPAYQAVLYSLRVAPIKVIGSQFCKGCAPIHHVIADSKDGMSYSQRRSPASLACSNAPKLRSQIGLLTASGGPSRFGQSAFEMLIAETTACGVTSPAALAVGRTHPAPGRRPLGAAKSAHVRAQFGHHHFGHFAVHARDFVQPLNDRLLLRQSASDLRVEILDLLVESFDVSQQLVEDQFLVLPYNPLQGLAQFWNFFAQEHLEPVPPENSGRSVRPRGVEACPWR